MTRLAIVDDHKMFREGLKSIISDFEGMEVVVDFENGREFLDHVKQDIDIVLLDLEMPDFNGIQTMEALHQSKSDIKVIFVSQNKEAGLISNMMELGARGYLFKDAEAEELKNAIHSVSETGYYFNDIVSQSMLIKLAGKDHVKPTFNHGEHLTDREQEVLQLICEELTTAEIGKKLFISPKTVENHRSRIMEKTDARNSAGLVVYAIKNKLINV